MTGPSLNDNELEALRILWELGELKPGQIQERFSWPIENATLRSVLVNLVEKGHAQRRLEGKAFYYGSRVPKATLLKSMMASLARVFAGGSPQQLVAQLIKTGDLKPADLRRLTEIATPEARQKGEKK